MKRHRKIRLSILGLVSLVVIGAYQSDYLLCELPEEKSTYYNRKFAKLLAEKQHVVAYWTFDDSRAVDLISGKPSDVTGTRLVAGRKGQGRYFNGETTSFIRTPVLWRDLGSNYTISMWVNISPDPPDQTLMCSQVGSLKSGLIMYDGKLNFVIPSSGETRFINYTFTNYNQSVHLAGVVDADHRRASLYENGTLIGSVEISAVNHPSAHIAFGRLRRERVYQPFHGTMDETVVWRRALNEEEIRSLSRLAVPYHETVEKKYGRRSETTEAYWHVISRLAKMVDAFNPFVYRNKLIRPGLPSYSFHLSRADMRHFNKCSNVAQRDGWLDREACGRRRIHVRLDSGMSQAEMALHASPGSLQGGFRESFTATWFSDDGVRVRKLFRPPEAVGWLRAMLVEKLERKLGFSSRGRSFAVVSVNNGVRGLYCVQPYDARGLVNWNDDVAFLIALQELPVTRADVLQAYDELVRSYGPSFAYDTGSAAGVREKKYRLQKDRKLIERTLRQEQDDKHVVDRILAGLDAASVLGENPAAFYIVEDLVFPSSPLKDVTVRWSSDREDIINGRGRVMRPAGKSPAQVVLTCEVEKGNVSKTRSLALRVMPQEVLMPAIMINLPVKVGKEVRADCLVSYWEEGRLTSHKNLAGRIRLRGSTSLVQKKKSYSIRMEDDQPFLHPNGSNFIYLQGSFLDRSLMRNLLCYDIYRSFSEKDAERYAPFVQFTELFLNGHYYGVYQMVTKVDRHFLGWGRFDPRARRHNVLYKADGPQANFKKIDNTQYDQVEPDAEDISYWEPYEEFVGFIARTSGKEFAGNIDRFIDVNAIMDFQLFVQAVGSWDGYRHNLYLARRGGTEDRFFIIPWDCDSTLAHEIDRWFTNNLFDRLMRCVPSYIPGLQARWSELRQGPLSDRILLERVDNASAQLKWYVPWEYERWGGNTSTFEQLCGGTREWLRLRMDYLDQHIARLEADTGDQE